MTLRRFIFIILSFFIFQTFGSMALAKKTEKREGIAESCECAEPKCNECEDFLGPNFYVQKCWKDKSKKKVGMKSCKEPICKPKENPTSVSCLKKKSNNHADLKDLEKAMEKPETVPKKIVRKAIPTTFTPKKKKSKKWVGKVVASKGEAWVERSTNLKVKLKPGKKVFVHDKLVTGKTGKIKIIFKDKNILKVPAHSKVVLSEMDFGSKTDIKRTVIRLLMGSVGSDVKQKYKDDDGSYYRIKTSSAVAGVKGTEFYTTLGNDGSTTIATLKGTVHLAGHKSNEGIHIPAGHKASYVVAEHKVFDSNDIDNFVQQGYLTPVYKLSAREVTELEQRVDLNERTVASSEENICTSPSGALNECLWSCENNPKGAKTCQTKLPKVRCVRKRCNANGIWAEKTRLPAAFHESCEATRVKVAPCDY